MNNIPTIKQFVKAVGNDKEHSRMYQHFNDVFRYVSRRGRICTPERMAQLYPVLREIYDEAVEIEEYWAKRRKR